MADLPSSSNSSSEIQINIKGPNELKVQINISLDKTVAELKQAIAEKSDVEAERQRLIYSGRVLKDEDPLSQYKIQSSHTIHMVKGAARQAASSSSGSSSGVSPQQLPTMQAGQNPSDPLTILNGPMGHGLMAGFNPFAEMGLNPNDPNMMQGMLNNPAFLQQMSSLMSNPAVVDQIISMNPQLSAMGPQMRQIMQSDGFRQMLSNPQALQSMMRMSSMFRDAGLAPGFGGGGEGAFPAPGMPSYAQNPGQTPGAPASNAASANNTAPSFNPSMYPPFPPAPAADGATGSSASPVTPGNGAGAQNPYAALASLLGSMPPPSTGGGSSPFGMVDPSLVQSLLGGMGGATAAPAPADTRSPEERFEVQLQQLQDMGFTNASQNVRALLATGGNVHAAIEYILGGGGL